MKFMVLRIMGLVLLLWPGSRVLAIPQNISSFCEVYPDSPRCQGGSVTCTSCHAIPPSLNSFGQDLIQALERFPDFQKNPQGFQQYLRLGLLAIEDMDSDGDGYSNIDEIKHGSEPGNTLDNPKPPPPDKRIYEPRLALRRIKLAFCGKSPNFEDFAELSEQSDAMPWLHQILEQCLQSRFWQDIALARLADPKIRPNESVGVHGNPFVVGDYHYDYRLFVHILTGGRDARDLLLADYHINENGEKTYAIIPSRPIPGRIVVGNGQPLIAERRAGMITTQWFLGTNTMFAELPRNTASQAYRAYLGLDIAKSQGLYPVANEPRDVDSKGVAAPACAICHSTLDPLSYSFASYNGLESGGRPGSSGVGAYNPSRTPWGADGVLFFQPVPDLLAWAQLAANSDEFKKNLTLMFYQYAIGHEPKTYWEEQDFKQLWQSLGQHGYQAEKLLHQLIETKSFAGVTP